MSFFQVQTTHPEKRPTKGGSGRQSRPVQLRHTGSLTYGKESQAARENFLAGIRGGKFFVYLFSFIYRLQYITQVNL